MDFDGTCMKIKRHRMGKKKIHIQPFACFLKSLHCSCPRENALNVNFNRGQNRSRSLQHLLH